MKYLAAILVSLLLLSLAGCAPSSVEGLRKAGKQAFLDKEYSKAREYFLAAIAKKPSDKELLYLAGLSYKRDFMYDSAFFYLGRLDLLYPDDRETNLQLYEVAVALERWDEAIHATDVLARTGDGLETYYYQLSELWEESGSPINALYWLRRAILYQPGSSQDWYVRAAELATKCDSTDLSISLLDSAIRIFDDKGLLAAIKATYHARKEQYIEAENLLRPLAESDSSAASYKVSLAHVLSAQDERRKKEEALDLYREVQSQFRLEFRIDSLIAELEKELK